MKMVLVSVDMFEKYFPKTVQSPADVETKLQQQARFLHEIPLQKQAEPASDQLPLNPDFVDGLAVMFRQRARFLVGHLEKNRDRIQWSESGELVYHGRAIPNSHIADLIYDLVKPVSAKRPAGSQEFLILLKQTNVARQYIANKTRINEMDVPLVAFGAHVNAPLVSDDLPPLPPTPNVPLRPPVASISKPILAPAAERVRQRRQTERARWNPY